MEKNKLEFLKKVISMWEIDLVNGTLKTKRGIVSKPNKEGRLAVGAMINGEFYQYYVHQVIAFAGGLDMLDKTVNHKNGNKLDNRLDNLECITAEENRLHAVENNLHQVHSRGSNHSNSNLTEEKVIMIRKLHSTGNYKLRELSDMFGICISGVSRIVKRITWTHI